MHPKLANVFDALNRLHTALQEAEPHAGEFAHAEVLDLWGRLSVLELPADWLDRAIPPEPVEKN
jgi:hypothetical protein